MQQLNAKDFLDVAQHTDERLREYRSKLEIGLGVANKPAANNPAAGPIWLEQDP